MQTTIYIRKENEKFWESLHDKSAWINEKLAEPFIGKVRARQDYRPAPPPTKTVSRDSYKDIPAKSDPTYTVAEAITNDLVGAGLCEHGADKRQCLQVKCKHSRYK